MSNGAYAYLESFGEIFQAYQGPSSHLVLVIMVDPHCSLGPGEQATPISTIGLVIAASSAAERPNRPTAIAESDLDSTHDSSTGITPSTKVRSSRRYLTSSAVNSSQRSSRVAFSSLVRLVLVTSQSPPEPVCATQIYTLGHDGILLRDLRRSCRFLQCLCRSDGRQPFSCRRKSPSKVRSWCMFAGLYIGKLNIRCTSLSLELGSPGEDLDEPWPVDPSSSLRRSDFRCCSFFVPIIMLLRFVSDEGIRSSSKPGFDAVSVRRFCGSIRLMAFLVTSEMSVRSIYPLSLLRKLLARHGGDVTSVYDPNCRDLLREHSSCLSSPLQAPPHLLSRVDVLEYAVLTFLNCLVGSSIGMIRIPSSSSIGLTLMPSSSFFDFGEPSLLYIVVLLIVRTVLAPSFRVVETGLLAGVTVVFPHVYMEEVGPLQN
ncbi:hypothetical protein KCU61_g469, partial [Aureobasidium melanogenum]